MGDDENKSLKMSNISKKETFTAEEKKMIMDRLNEERLIHQKANESLRPQVKNLTKEDKAKILQQLNERRLTRQKREEIEKKRLYKKEVYSYGGKKLYKLMHMEREYYIDIEECEKLTKRPKIVSLYYRLLEELKRKEVLIKIENYSEKIFISKDPIRVYFKGYSLENEDKK